MNENSNRDDTSISIPPDDYTTQQLSTRFTLVSEMNIQIYTIF